MAVQVTTIDRLGQWSDERVHRSVQKQKSEGINESIASGSERDSSKRHMCKFKCD